MRNNRGCWLLCAALLLGWVVPAEVCGFDLGGAINRAKKEKEKAEKAKRDATGESQKKDEKPATGGQQGGAATGGETAGTPAAPTAATGGQVVFSKAPIDVANPAGLVNAFAAGDEIYALAKFAKPIEQIFPDKNEFMLLLQVDGKDEFYQYVQLKTPEAKKRDYLVVEIAPNPEKMTSYRDENYGWNEGKRNKRLGPHGFSWVLSQLQPGKHTVTLRNRNFGDPPVITGSFTIDGQDFAVYNAVHQKIEQAMNSVASMPPAQMTDLQMQAKMMELLRNAGWKSILQLRIVDKDWWMDLKEGGNSAVVSRHLDAAAAYKDENGNIFYKICQFHQYKQIDGSFGPLTLTNQGRERPISEENLSK
jgi:hypothetical protein